jgi:Uma2 family endonuclease
MVIAESRLTLAEFLRLPEEKPALEYEDGEMTQKVSPKAEHSATQGGLAELVNAFARPRKLARAFVELRTTFGGSSVVPDVSIYRWDRIERTPEGRLVNDVTTPPDIAIEVVSPSQHANTLVRRCLWYVANGVSAAVLIDPEDRSLVVFRPNANGQSVTGDERLPFDDVLPGFELTANELFRELAVD